MDKSSVGGTLTAGIQDISALLPIIGTQQCETHIGSALEGGYLYASATPLSIFGSLGIVKAGVSILIASISIPKVSFSFNNFKPSIRVLPDRWLGARILENAGFKLPGNIAPMISIEGERYQAETRLIKILEEKRIQNPENVKIRWKSIQWNNRLIISTTIAGIMSLVPYFALLVGSTSWRPHVHQPWIFPILRTVGSCLAAVCCQLIIQYRVISLMKNRILFMAIHRELAQSISKEKVNLELWLKSQRWDSALPAEECLGRLDQFLPLNSDSEEPGQQFSISVDDVSTPKPLSAHPNLHELCEITIPDLRCKHFPNRIRGRERVMILVPWIILCLSLPATVAGYIGCFTLISSSPGNGPLIWLGLEVALSIIRILVWASNPNFDEETDVTIKLALTQGTPPVTTENKLEYHFDNTDMKCFPLVPENEFLDQLLPYTGPQVRFEHSENFSLYFTVFKTFRSNDFAFTPQVLAITFVDSTKQISGTLLQIGWDDVILHFPTAIQVSSGRFEAAFLSATHTSSPTDHLWPIQYPTFFFALAEYYKFMARAIRGRPSYQRDHRETLPWNLLPNRSIQDFPSLTDNEQLYFRCGYEHSLKMGLINKLSRWTTKNIRNMVRRDRFNSYAVSEDPVNGKEKCELDSQLAWEWTTRELALLVSSMTLEDSLRKRMEKWIGWEDAYQISQLSKWILSEFEIGRRMRLEKEKEEAKERMKKATKDFKHAETERWSGTEGSFETHWEEALKFIEQQWSAGIVGGVEAIENAESALATKLKGNIQKDASELNKTLLGYILRQRSAHWDAQRKYERQMIDATIERISNLNLDDTMKEMDSVYWYPEPDEEAANKFVDLRLSKIYGKACSAMLYNAQQCGEMAIYDVANKITTRSLINVDPTIADSVPPNEHILFIGTRTEPAFVQQNRTRWWDQQTGNSSTFFFTPYGVWADSCYVQSSRTIAHIYVFLTDPSYIRLSLLHCCLGDACAISIREKGEELLNHTDTMSSNVENLQWEHIELGKLQPGRHDLEVVPIAKTNGRFFAQYHLRDIFVEICRDSFPAPQHPRTTTRM